MALPFQPWPSLPYAVERDLAVLTDFYVRITDGSDVTGSGTPSRPYRTPQRALREIGSFGRAVIHLGSGTYQRPLLNDIRGPVVFVGDGGGDPADDGVNVVVAAQAAQAGTGAGVVVGAGFVAGARRGDQLEMLSGAAAGQVRSICDNTATDLIPTRNFNPVPAPGDLFQVITPAAVFDGLSASGMWIQRCGAKPASLAFGPTGVPDIANTWDGVYIVNIALDGPAGSFASILDSTLHAYGLDIGANVVLSAQNSAVLSGMDTISPAVARQLAALLSIPDTLYAGRCLTRRSSSAANFSGSTFSGFIPGDPGQLSLLQGSFGQFRGGHLFQRLFLSLNSVAALDVDQAPRTRITRVGAGDCINGTLSKVSIAGSVQIAADAGDGVRLSRGAIGNLSGLSLISSVTGSAVDASQGGHAYVLGSPAGNWAGGGADTRVSATETQPAAFYGAIDATLVAAVGNGSIITRAS